ncbi:hypothetical protein HK105_204740 [Polyrhizophydium stewartii]|uniref:CCR4-NOT transcription complex subunit 11 n=1 Tax=Polyrhizophydium stewartii TaxID=2732419 RepID=A0ABR4N8E7_9FUNG
MRDVVDAVYDAHERLVRVPLAAAAEMLDVTQHRASRVLALLLLDPLLLPTPELRAVVLFALAALYPSSPALSTLLQAVMLPCNAFAHASLGERVLALHLLRRDTKAIEGMPAGDALALLSSRAQGSAVYESAFEAATACALERLRLLGEPLRLEEPDGQWTMACAKEAARYLLANDFCGGFDILDYTDPSPPITLEARIDLPWVFPPLADPSFVFSEPTEDEIRARDHARRLVIYAAAAPLTTAQTRTALEWLERSYFGVYQCGVTGDMFSGMIEHNPNIACEVLLAMRYTPDFPMFLDALIGAATSIHAMEIVNKAVTAVDLPQEFLHLFVASSIAACDAIRDRFMQSRQVRLICVFVQSLIHNKVIALQDYVIDLQTFCLEYSRVKEAAALYRMVRKETGQADALDALM